MRHLVFGLALLVACAIAPTASASQVVSTSTATDLTLSVNAKGEALVSYRSGGKEVHLLAWGAENALPPTAGGQQVSFQLDYTGGYKKYFRDDAAAQKLVKRYDEIKGKPGYLANPVVKELRALQQSADNYWRDGFAGSCGRYDGPELAFMVAACKAPDGSYWAVQSWQRGLPDYGRNPTPAQSAFEVHLSHWTGPLPVLTVHTDWAWHRWDHLFGTYTYDGNPVFGFTSTHSGQPLDSFGRNVYLDTFDSAYGQGWMRENSFLTHNPTGVFCYSVNPHPPVDPTAGTGSQYRLTVEGPGVTPDVSVTVPSPGPYDATADAQANAEIVALHDKLCQPH